MKFYEVRAVFTSTDIPLAEERISEIFFAAGLKGVVCDVPIPEPDQGFGTQTLPFPDRFSVTGYVPVSDSGDILLLQIQKQAVQLKKCDIHVTLETTVVDEKDWENEWKAFFHVIKVSSRFVIKPEWRQYQPQPGDLVITIDPGMAFGTGTHPSTGMCLGLMDQYFRPGRSFLDVGTGSGILMIAAVKLGALFAEGIDNDEIAIEVARQNLDKNRIPSEQFNLKWTTLDQLPVKSYDFIAANIIARVIMDILAEIHKRLAPDGMAVLSGLIAGQETMIRSALDRHHFQVVEKVSEAEWIALAVKK